MGSEDFIGLGHRWSRSSDIVTNNFMLVHMLFDCFVILFMIQSFNVFILIKSYHVTFISIFSYVNCMQ